MLFAGIPLTPELYLSYQQEEIQDNNSLVRSGLMVTSAAIQDEFAKGGKTVDLPFFGDLTGDDEIDSDTVPSNPQEITGDVQTGVRLARRKSWKASDLAAEISGADPLQAISRSTGRYWVRRMQASVQSILTAMFATNGPLASSHGVGGNSTLLTGGAMISGIAKLGDAGKRLSAVGMHSGAFYDLMGQDLIIPASTTTQIDTRLSAESLELGTYLGRPVFVDDALPFYPGAGTGGKTAYDIYFFGPGAFAYATVPAKTPVESDRDTLLGVDLLVNRTHYIVHPNGLSWKGNAAASSPTNTELATPSNWVKVFDDNKNIKITRLRAYAG